MIYKFRKKLFIILFLIIALLISSCMLKSKDFMMDDITNNGKLELNKATIIEPKSKSKEIVELYDTTYKIFYGEWKIEKIIGYDNQYNKSFPEADAMLGTTIFYDYNQIKTEESVIENYKYNYTINPNHPNDYYFNKTFTNETLGLKGNYYVFVHVEKYIPELKISEDFVGDEFFVVSDNELIIVKNNVFYLAKRISYIDDSMDYSHI